MLKIYTKTAWKWSRIKHIVSGKISNAFIAIFVLGTVIRMDNIMSNIGLNFAENNYFINLFFPNKAVLSSIEIAYIGSIFHFGAFIVFVLYTPRTINISLSRSDFVIRSANNIHTRNISSWITEIKKQITEKEFSLPSEVEQTLDRYTAYIAATLDKGDEIKIDSEFNSAIISTLQCRYESENTSKHQRRAIITCLMLISFSLGAISTIGTIIENLFIIL